MDPMTGRFSLHVPDSPPLAVLAAVAAAAERAAELAGRDRRLHVELDEETGRAVAEVRDPAGNVLRAVPPSEALAIMCGTRPLGG
jgi:hypothetical protein